MFPALQSKLARFEELERQLEDPAVLTDSYRLQQVQREYGGLAKVALKVREFNNFDDEIAIARQMADEETDPDTKAYAQTEYEQLAARKQVLQNELEDIVLAGDALTRGSLIMEIRAGTGGEEAALFARDLWDMYQRYAAKQNWKTEVLEFSDAEMGGIREVVFSITGDGAYRQLQFESGGHRVQRVPATETQGRVHTSLATVAVLPEATEVEIDIKDEDLQIDTMRAGGPGGQKVNKTESAIRITHLPTGLVVKCQDEKSQHKNKARALRVLRSRLLELRTQEAHDARASQRKLQVGSGDRSERIRTYNFPQNRLTDHRINLTLYKLDQTMQGDLDELVAELLKFDREERLRNPDPEPAA
ncbi:MAG: peptide chain release factor 1 [Planctomycetes bacterium]|nr:peptide chain release factor 1 [Planctomycetota bacterium]